MVRITRQGFPPAMTLDGISFVTTLPAAMILLSPMVTPGVMVTPPQIHTLFPTVIGHAYSSHSFRRSTSEVTCRIEAHVGGDEHVVAYGDGSLVEHNAIVVGKRNFCPSECYAHSRKRKAI